MKNILKRTLAITLVLMMNLSFASCSEKEASESKETNDEIERIYITGEKLRGEAEIQDADLDFPDESESTDIDENKMDFSNENDGEVYPGQLTEPTIDEYLNPVN